jgi:Lon protease-like protein
MDQFLLPLFPLEAVLLPDELLPLHIFEDRYKTMIRDCLAAQRRETGRGEFGIVLDKGEEMSHVGCSAEVVEVKRQYPDGRLDIVTQGKRRFSVLFTDEQKEYLRAGVEFFEDEAGSEAPTEEEAGRVLWLMQEAVKRLREPRHLPASPDRPYHYLSFQIAALLPFSLEFREQLLSIRGERDRVRAVSEGIEQLIPQLDRAIAVERKTAGNGHLLTR